MKRLLIFILSIFFTIAFCGQIKAKVTGVCSNCHTMHNSQGGAPMAFQINVGHTGYVSVESPNPQLLLTDCVGCHTAIGGDTWKDLLTGAPIVYNTGEPVTCLAGGNFYYVENTNDNRGHNILNTNPDEILGNTPPGATEGSPLSAQLRCAGTYGCHGNRDTTDQVDAMKGSHHTDDSGGITGGSVGLSYRFLKGILGTEDSDWEQDNTNNSHNEYKGAINFTTTSSISYLCGNCHSNFHTDLIGEVGTTSPWLRHPTDYTLPGGTTEYAGYTSYSMLAPVARPNLSDLPATPDIARPGTDVIMCLSCHRAHGSPNYKMIRWDNQANMSGCVVCHKSKY